MDELILRGVRAYTLGHVEESARLWRDALEIDPGNERALRYLFQLQGETLEQPPPDTPASSCPAIPETPPPGTTEPLPAGEPAPPPAGTPESSHPGTPESLFPGTTGSPVPPPPAPVEATDAAAAPVASPQQAPGTGRFKLPDHVSPAPGRRASPRRLLPVAIGMAVTCVVALSAWGVVELSRRDGPSVLGSAWDGVQAAWSRLSALPGWLAGQARERAAGTARTDSQRSPGPSTGSASRPTDVRRAGQPEGDRPASRSQAPSPSPSAGPDGTRLAAATLAGFDGAPAHLLPGARWGMSVDEALARLPSASNLSRPGPAPVLGLARLARAGPVILEGQRYDAELLFGEDGGLKAILLASSVPGGARDAFDALTRRLGTELGAPAEEDRAAPGVGPWHGRSRWTARFGSIDVEGRDAEARLLSVDVRRGNVKPIPNGNVSIVLLHRDTPAHAGEP